jgi:acyl-CoA reductase-like NAD-dependent aldehyde dehydrogenase
MTSNQNAVNGPNGNHNSVKMDFTTFTNIIDGKHVTTKTTRRAVNSATNEELWECPLSTKQDMEDAIQAARTAFQSWRKTTVEERKEMIMVFCAAMSELRAEFAQLLMTEQGKPVRTSKNLPI